MQYHHITRQLAETRGYKFMYFPRHKLSINYQFIQKLHYISRHIFIIWNQLYQQYNYSTKIPVYTKLHYISILTYQPYNYSAKIIYINSILYPLGLNELYVCIWAHLICNIIPFLYSWFHIKGTWSVHSFNGDYLSNPEGTDSCGYLFLWNPR